MKLTLFRLPIFIVSLVLWSSCGFSISSKNKADDCYHVQCRLPIKDIDVFTPGSSMFTSQRNITLYDPENKRIIITNHCIITEVPAHLCIQPNPHNSESL